MLRFTNQLLVAVGVLLIGDGNGSPLDRAAVLRNPQKTSFHVNRPSPPPTISGKFIFAPNSEFKDEI